jgi:hypothetical protein
MAHSAGVVVRLATQSFGEPTLVKAMRGGAGSALTASRKRRSARTERSIVVFPYDVSVWMQ